MAAVTDSQDFGDVAAKFRGTPNTVPDPYGGLVWEVDGIAHRWRGRARDVGLVEMKPGDRIEMLYDPQDPTRISTLVLLGRNTGFSLAAGAVVFLLFYVWFFWLRPRRV